VENEFIEFHDEEHQRVETERKTMAPCVAEIIERHSKIE
jgi:hypothetical protein